MLPRFRLRFALPVVGSLLGFVAAISIASPGTIAAADAATSQVSHGRTIGVDGIELAVPRPGTGVGVSVIHADGSTSLVQVQADPEGRVSVSRAEPELGTAASQPQVSVAALSACSDPKFKRTGSSWRSTVHWSFKASSTPTYLGVTGVEGALKHAMGNITHERNDCGRPDTVSARAVYDGRTTRGPHIGADAGCRHADGANVVAFGDLPPSTLAFTCWWFVGSRTIEADTAINKRDFTFALSVATCAGGYILEGVATHEFGHVFGLGHVAQAKHGALTMSPQIYPCDNSDSTLGLGDMLGLESLY